MSPSAPETGKSRPRPEAPRREATARLAFLAVALVFFVGLTLGFILGRTL
jgi:hypothetical protein